MTRRTNLFAALLVGLLVGACGGSTSVRGSTNMQPATHSELRSSGVEPLPSLECKAPDHRCGGDDECCSNFCVDQRCTAPQ
jgi:hypothetical protein